jgi:hypothetical protein
MIASSILFKLPLSTNWEGLRKIALDRAEKLYPNISGLKSKAFVLNEDTGDYGGLYLWEDKDSLEAFLASETFSKSKDLFGTPDIKIFDVVAHIEKGKHQ